MFEINEFRLKSLSFWLKVFNRGRKELICKYFPILRVNKS